jgi:exopolysaccharide production protein ExoY
MKMGEGRNHNLALQVAELLWSGNGSRAHDNESPQKAGSRQCDASFPDVPCWKRVLDVTCVLVTLPLWLPLIVVVMAWIAIVSRGPVFFRQERVGYRRRHFMIFKFRTMHVNADTQTHAEYFFRLMEEDCPMTKLDAAGDPRLIAGGRFLRASGLDELPQIFNVLRGEMSLVGPRPCLPHEFERYDAWQQERVNAPPGLTGFWQVNGKNKTTFSEMIAMDIFYARNMSPGLDLRIIVKTIPALIEQMLERHRAHETESRQRSVRTIAVPKNTNGAVEKI